MGIGKHGITKRPFIFSSCAFVFYPVLHYTSRSNDNSLSWSDTAASTIGRLLGSHTPPLPAYLPFTNIPFAPRKSLAGFLAAALTGFLIGLSYWAGGKRVDGGWGELWGGNVDLTSWSGEKLGGWAFLKEGWGRWATAGVLGIAGAVVEALGEFRCHTGSSFLFSRYPVF